MKNLKPLLVISDSRLTEAFALVDSRLFNTRFVCYNDWALLAVCLPSVYLTSSHAAKLELGKAWE